ncbi:MAG: 2-hydroxyacid dehydrogenase [Bacteroidota bacterium]
MKILLYSAKLYDREYFSAAAASFNHQVEYSDASLDIKTAVLAAGCNAACIFVNDRADAPVLQALRAAGVRTLALRCAGFNNVDIPEAERLGIAVVRVPAYSPEAVAEHACALLMTLNRKTHKAYNRVREGNFSLEHLTGFNIHGKTVGIIGLGRIGLAFARIMNGFGSKVLGYDPLPPANPENINLVSLDELAAQSDIISLHCPLSPGTKHIINAAFLAKMKAGAFLINTGRGGLLCTEDAIQALKTQHLGALAIDVYEQEEKLFFRDLSESIIPDELVLRLMSFPNVLITGHQAFFTREALAEIAHTTLQNLADIEQGTATPNRIRPV